jgi:hypothetical protein
MFRWKIEFEETLDGGDGKRTVRRSGQISSDYGVPTPSGIKDSGGSYFAKDRERMSEASSNLFTAYKEYKERERILEGDDD